LLFHDSNLPHGIYDRRLMHPLLRDRVPDGAKHGRLPLALAGWDDFLR